MLFRPSIAATLLLLGCGASKDAPAGEADACAPPSRVVGDRCLEPGVQDNGCPAGTLGLEDGSCETAGIPEALCAEGFVPEDRACKPILPAEPCPPGLIAVPGDAQCRRVAPCGAGAWGDIPLEANTIYVDARYPGIASDGSAAKPWTRITDAYDHAPNGTLIAVAAGTYVENVVFYRPMRLWGVCPERVAIVGTGSYSSAVGLYFASGTEIHDVAVSGPTAGIDITGSENVVLERVWVHDVGWRGITTDTNYGPTSLTVSDSLIESAREAGISVVGRVPTTIERTMVRDTLARITPITAGIIISLRCTPMGCEPDQPADVTVRGLVVERNEDAGIIVAGSHAHIEGSVIRTTRPTSAQDRGFGIATTISCHPNGSCYPEPAARVSLVGSLVEENHTHALFAYGGDTTIEASVIRATKPRVFDDAFGLGVNIEACEAAHGCARPSWSMRWSVVEDNHEMGARILGGDATIEGAVFRDTQPRASDHVGGHGLDFSCDFETGCAATRSTATVRGSLVERNHDVSVAAGGADVLLDGVLVRDTLPRASDGGRGRGIHIEVVCPEGGSCLPDTGAQVTLRSSLVAHQQNAGIIVIGSSAVIEHSVVRATAATASTGLFGDGVMLFSDHGPASATFTNNRIENHARAGISSFGAFTSIGGSVIACSAFELAGQKFFARDYTFEDRGGNACGCPAVDGACSVVSPGLEPPDSLE